MRPPAAPRPSRRAAPRAEHPDRREPPDRQAREPGAGSGPDGGQAPGTGEAPPAARVVVPRREPTADMVRRSMASVSTGLRDRLDERGAAARRLLLRKVLLGALVLAVLAGVAWLLLASPVLALRAEEVTVTGTGTTVDAAEVHAAVAPEAGTPLLRLDLADMRDRVEGITTVRSATLAREWPNGLSIALDSREPVAAAAGDEGYVLLDDEGVQVGVAEQVPDGLPEVTVPLEDSDRTGPALVAVLGVLSELPADLLAQVHEAGAESGREVVLELDDGATVRWGSAEDGDLKAAVLEVLRQRPAAVYDVSIPRAPTTRE